MSDAYEIVTFRGHRMDRMTAQALSRMETKLGYTLTVLQGSYNGGTGRVSQSAGTHDGGGAVDLAPADWQRKVRVGREVGFAMWHRTRAEGPWVEHCHGILIGNSKASTSALRQVTAYKNGRNGLANNGPDTFWWRPRIISAFRYAPIPTVGVSLSALRVDFLNALGGKRNASRYRGKIVQRRLNSLVGANLRVDGVIGMKTVEAWRRWEHKTGVVGRPGVPDENSLKRLLKGTVYFMRK